MKLFPELIRKKWKFLLFLAIAGGLFGTSPYIAARMVAGDSWQGVVPKFTEDSLYYMTRANAAIHGDFMANPYYSIPYTDPSPTFSLADGVAGIPYSFLNPYHAAIWNAFFWSGVFAVLIGILFLSFGYSLPVILLTWLIFACGLFEYLLRATNMQIFYPYFLLFVLLLFRTVHYGIRNGTENKKVSLFIGICAGFSPYLYTFLFQIMAASLFSGLLIAVALRYKKLAKSLLISMLVMVMVSIPYLLYFAGLKFFPYTSEIINHFFGIRSHVPSPMLYYYGRWLVLLFGWLGILWFINKDASNNSLTCNKKGSLNLHERIITLLILAFGTLGIILESPILGMDVASVSHGDYFIKFLMPISVVLLIFPTIQTLRIKNSLLLKVPLLVFSIAITARLMYMLLPGQFSKINEYIPNQTELVYYAQRSPQYTMPTLMALNSLQGPQIIAAPEPLNSYIPIYLDQHVLFSIYGAYFSTGTLESVQRSLASKLGSPLTLDEVRLAVADASQHRSELKGRNNVARKLCNLFTHFSECSTLIVAEPYTFKGEFAYELWYLYYKSTIQKHPKTFLRIFNVTQVVIEHDQSIPEFLANEEPWYSDQYYAVYDVKDLIKKQPENPVD